MSGSPNESFSVKNANGFTSEKGDGVAIREEALGDDPAFRRTLLKMDLSVVSVFAVFYFFSFLDRSNLGNAKVAHLQRDLGLTDHQYSIALTVTYVPYIAVELPGNLILRRVGAQFLLPAICTIWGIVCTLQGLVTSYSSLLTVRFFLGLIEGPMFPGIVLVLSSFYTRKELQLRIALFFSAASLSGAFSGLLAYAIVNLDGKGGKPGWAWIFIIEGMCTVVWGIISFFLMPNSPATNRFLTQEEKDFVMRRLANDRPTAQDVDDHFSWFQVFTALKRPHTYLQFVDLFMCGTTLYSIAYFQPVIVNSLGYSATRTQLFSVPPFAVAFIVMIGSSYFADRYSSRGVCTMIFALVGLVGYVLFYTHTSHSVRYGSLFLTVAGIYSTAPPLSAWMSTNSEPHYRRSTSIALGFVATNCGGILSTWIFPTSESPNYHTGTVIGISFSIGMIVVSAINMLWLRRENVHKHRDRDALLAPYQGHEQGDAEAWRRLGDQHPDFQYSY